MKVRLIMSVSTDTDGNKYIIKLEGCFNFAIENEFCLAYKGVETNKVFVLDFSAVESIDSTTLGMLLLLRDYAGGDKSNIELSMCSPDIKNILEISNFQKLFTIT